MWYSRARERARVRAVTLVSAFGLVVAGCSEPAAPGPETELLTGTITEIRMDGHAWAPMVLIEEYPGQEGETGIFGQKCWMAIRSYTRFEHRLSDGSTRRTGFRDVEVGMDVTGWQVGIVIDTYPCLATASRIIVHPLARHEADQ